MKKTMLYQNYWNKNYYLVVENLLLFYYYFFYIVLYILNPRKYLLTIKFSLLRQNEELKVHSDPPFVDKSAKYEVFIKDLFEIF